MPNHGEGPAEGAFNEGRLEAELRFVELRDATAKYYDYLYKDAHRDVRDDCDQFAEYLTEYTFASLGVSDQYSTHPGTAQLFHTYRRLVFAFTNPADLTDGIDEQDVRDFIAPIGVTASKDDDKVNIQLFIYGLEVRTTFLLAKALELEPEWVIAGWSYAARFEDAHKRTVDELDSIVKGRLDPNEDVT